MPIAKPKLSLPFWSIKKKKKIRNKKKFLSRYEHNFFCSRNDVMGKYLLALDMDGIVNELPED